MASPTQPLGPYVNNNLEAIPGGALQFLDVDTIVPKTVYADSELTVLADNPIFLTSASTTPYQIYYGEGDYLVRLYELVDPDMVSPVFPADYAIVREWENNGLEDTSSGAGSLLPDDYALVETIQDLTDTISPNDYTYVEVIGYYNGSDDIDTRMYKWDALSVAPADGGAVLASSLVGTGRWLLKSEAPRIDVRWFGAIPNNGVDCNSAITSALAYGTTGTDTPKEVYFVAGTYQVVPGTITTQTPIEMSEDAIFFNRLAGDLEIEVEKDFDIKKKEPMQHPASVGGVILDFRNNDWATAANETIDPRWYEDTDECFQYAGGNPVLIRRAEVFQISADVNAYLVFRGGSIDITSSGSPTMTVTNIDAMDKKGIKFISNASPVNGPLSFVAGLTLYSDWFETIDDLKYPTKTDCELVMNDVKSLPSGYVMSLSTLANIRGEGGYFNIAENASLQVPRNLIGKIIRCQSESLTVDAITTQDDTTLNSSNYYIDDSATLLGAVDSMSNVNDGYANFSNERLPYTLSTGSRTGLQINGLILDGALTVNGYVTFVNSNIRGNVTGSGTVQLNNSLIQPANDGGSLTGLVLENNSTMNFSDASTFNLNTLEATNSRINPFTTGTAANLNISLGATIRECSVGRVSLNSIGSMSNPIDFQMDDCNVFGGFWVPSGTAQITQILIRRNQFYNTAGDAYYVPIQEGTLDPQATVVSAWLLGYSWDEQGPDGPSPGQGEFQYNPPTFGPILIADNSPFQASFSQPAANNTLISVGYDRTTIVKQTRFNMIVYFDKSASSGVNSPGWNVAYPQLKGGPNTGYEYEFIWRPDGMLGRAKTAALTTTDGYCALNNSAELQFDLPLGNAYADRSFTGTLAEPTIFCRMVIIDKHGSSSNPDSQPYQSTNLFMDLFPS
jgi:hypothetical protein